MLLKCVVFFQMQVEVCVENSGPVVKSARCECAISLNASCGHITGLLYQLANFKTFGIKALPEDIAKTPLPHTFHLARGEKLGGKSVQDVEVRGYAMTQNPGYSNEEPKNIKPHYIQCYTGRANKLEGTT